MDRRGRQRTFRGRKSPAHECLGFAFSASVSRPMPSHNLEENTMGHIIRRYPRVLAAFLMAIVTAGVAVAQQAHGRRHPRRSYRPGLRGRLEPGRQDAGDRRASTIRSASGTPPPARRSRSSRDTPSWSWPSRSRPTASTSCRGARIIRPRSGIVPTSGPVKTFAGHAGRACRHWPSSRTASSSPRRPASRSRSGTSRPGRRQGPRRPRRRRASASWRGDGGQLATGDKAHTIRLWKGDLTPDGAIETPADGRARPGLSAQQPTARLGGIRRAGPALAASGRRPATVRRQGTGRGLRSQPRRHQARHRRGRQGRPDLEPGRRQTDQGDHRPTSRSSRSRSSRMARSRGGTRQQDRADLSASRTARRSRRSKGSRRRSPRWPFEATAPSSPSRARTTRSA